MASPGRGFQIEVQDKLLVLTVIDTIHGTIQLPNEPAKEIRKLPR
jgi:hypothetical protein